MSVNHDNSKIELTGIFENFSNDIVLDDTVPTSLQDEFLLNSNRLLEIKKKFSVSSAGAVTEETVIICEHPDNPELADLLSKKEQL